MLSTSSLLLLCCLATIAGRIPGSRGIEIINDSSHLGYCWESYPTSSTFYCSFHQNCIESAFQCGPQGLALGYAKPRCQNLALLQHSDSECQHCIESRAVFDWALLSERCFQQQLQVLLKDHQSEGVPDPPDCLQFEQEALDMLQFCLMNTLNTVCQVPDNVLVSDMRAVIDAVVVKPYYKSAVTNQFLEMMLSCGLSPLLDKIAPVTEWMYLCASLGSSKGRGPDEDLTQALAANLHQSSTDFLITSYDPQFVTMCQKASQPEWSVGSANYSLVLWTLSSGADTNALTLCQSAGQCTWNGKHSLVYFQLTELTSSSCGNGLREAGEGCDLSVYTGTSGLGCDTQCQAIPGYECTTEQLQQSSCSMTVCGDGLRTSDEECDEGSESFVGCNSESCTIKEGYRCETPYNAASNCTQIL